MFLENGILFVALLRLMILPYGIVSYLLGVTCISIWDYMIGTSAYIVKIALFVIMGCGIWQATEELGDDQNPDLSGAPKDKTGLIVLIVEIIVTVLITVIITIWAKYYFDKKFDETEQA